MLELAEHILAISGHEGEIVFGELPEDDPQRRHPDVTRAKEVLGWAPRVPLADGLGRTIDWFRTALVAEAGEA